MLYEYIQPSPKDIHIALALKYLAYHIASQRNEALASKRSCARPFRDWIDSLTNVPSGETDDSISWTGSGNVAQTKGGEGSF